MCSWVSSEQTVIFLEMMAMLPAEVHGKISVFLDMVAEGDKRASEILRMVNDDIIIPEDALNLLDKYLEWRAAGK